MHGARSAAPIGLPWNAGPLPPDRTVQHFSALGREAALEIDRLTGQNVLKKPEMM